VEVSKKKKRIPVKSVLLTGGCRLSMVKKRMDGWKEKNKIVNAGKITDIFVTVKVWREDR